MERQLNYLFPANLLRSVIDSLFEKRKIFYILWQTSNTHKILRYTRMILIYFTSLFNSTIRKRVPSPKLSSPIHLRTSSSTRWKGRCGKSWAGRSSRPGTSAIKLFCSIWVSHKIQLGFNGRNSLHLQSSTIEMNRRQSRINFWVVYFLWLEIIPSGWLTHDSQLPIVMLYFR